ncbi:MAG TPA: hypothetical protein VL198_15460 [Pseudolabrys sp.]|nr:hypothetical protein [Pseudolabrys sp.]
MPRCLTADAKCDAAMIDLDGDGKDEILLFTSGVGQSAALVTRRKNLGLSRHAGQSELLDFPR